MTLIEAQLILDMNCGATVDHDLKYFCNILHEKRLWSINEYWLLEQALDVLSGEMAEMPNDILYKAFKVYSFIMISISSFCDPDDSFVINNISRNEARELEDRLRIVFDGFFSQNMPDIDCFEVKNPLMKKGSSDYRVAPGCNSNPPK